MSQQFNSLLNIVTTDYPQTKLALKSCTVKVETKAHTVELSFIQYQQIQMKSSCMCFIATRNDLNRPQEKNSSDVQAHLANCHRILCKEYPIKNDIICQFTSFCDRNSRGTVSQYL